ncbi:MAG: HEAT repeat domain-containing protein [Myxococcales bacterium]
MGENRPTPPSPLGAPAASPGPKVSATAGADAAARLRAAQSFFLGLRKGVRQLLMFPEDPARRGALVRSLSEPLLALLSGGPVAISVQPDAFTFGQEAMWAIEGTDDTPGRFYKSGIRSLGFAPGFSDAELDALVGVLLTPPDRAGEGQARADDFATQLFNAALPHLSVGLSESYAFGGLTESQMDLELHQRVTDLERRHAAASPELRAKAAALVQGLDQKLEGLENKAVPYLVQGQPSESFRDRALQDSLGDDTRRLAPQLIALSLQHVRSGALSDPARAGELLARLVDAMLAQGNLEPFATLLDALLCLPEPQGPAIAQVLSARLGDESRLQAVARLLNAPRPDYGSLARYLAECRATAGVALLGLLPGLEPAHSKLLVLEAVAGLDKDAWTLLADRLDVEGAAVVPDVLSLVERLPPAERGKLFDRAIHHRMPEIRVAALKALAQTSIPEAMHRFVLDATKDADSRIRNAAWRTLVALSPARAAQDLLRLPKLPDWDKRPLQEREFLFECLGRTESNEAFAYLTSLLQVPKKGLFGGKRVELKLLAVLALQNMPVLQSFKLLQAVGAIPDQDPEATAAAQKAAEVVREAVLGAGASGGKAKPKVGPEPLPDEVARALEHVKKRLLARAPAPQTAPAPVGAPEKIATDPAFDFTEPVAAAPAWASPVSADKKRGGGR